MWKRLLLIMLVGVMLAGCSNSSEEAWEYDLGKFSKNFVEFEILLREEVSGERYLIGIFTPEEPDLHLYSMGFPLEGVDGVGRPTLLEFVSGPIEFVGPVESDVEAYEHEFPFFEEPLSIYPDGPVRLSVLVEVPSIIPDDLAVELAVTFMACSSAGDCRPPVVRRQIIVSLPAELWE